MKELNVYLVDINDIDVDSIFNGEYFSDDERKEFEKYTNEAVRKERIVSRYLKNKYIKDYYIDDNGKPLANDKHFNISHSHGMVVLVIDIVPVGIDIELVRKHDDKLTAFISSSEEKEYIHDDESFFNIWTNKEALTKAFGLGIREDVKKIPALPIDGLREYHGHTYRNKTVKYGNYVLAISRASLEEFDINIIKEL